MTVEVLNDEDLTRAEADALWDQHVNLDDWDYILVMPADALCPYEDSDTLFTPFHSQIEPSDLVPTGPYSEILCRMMTGTCDNRFYLVDFRGARVGLGVAYHA